MLKNTFLGMAVFESYGYVISSFTPLSSSSHNHQKGERTIDTIDRMLLADVNEDYTNDNNDGGDGYSTTTNTGTTTATAATSTTTTEVLIEDEPDEYARATLPVHFGAGFVAGSIHGIVSSTIMVDSSHPIRHIFKQLTTNTTTSISSSTRRKRRSYYWTLSKYVTYNTIHHSIAHSLLFGSYEYTKRSFLSFYTNSIDRDTKYFGGAYLLGFGLAGGIAGQIQHIISHCTEQIVDGLMMENGKTSSTGTTTPITSSSSSPTRISLPTFRSVLWAFPSSAIGFIAFEYGKKLTS